MHRHWEDCTAPEFQTLDPGKTIAILPIGAIEQHGPHLPTGTDTYINLGMLNLLEEMCPNDLDIRIVPIQAIGKSNEHLWSRGTITLQTETALRVWTDIGDSLARSNIRKLVIVNSHGGNVDPISIVARDLRVRHGMYVVKSHWNSFGHPTDLYPPEEHAYGIHGGDIETSLMLHFRPDLVKMDKAQNFRSTAETASIPPTGPVSVAWVASDLNPHGVVGNAAAATAAKGKATARHQV
ncbi:MAG: creatininase family protein, partial [Rhodobacteraceae bacterium]|nr:creatininase family protein [Paracoccaceae bacterium]